jgi:hypothetical protein
MNAPVKGSLILALSVVALGAGGCARMGGNAAGESIAAARSSAATSAAVSFTQADLDGDARITRQEFDLWLRGSGPSGAGAPAAAGGTGNRDAFDAADTNLNGALTLDEWQAMMTPPNVAAGASLAPPSRAR